MYTDNPYNPNNPDGRQHGCQIDALNLKFISDMLLFMTMPMTMPSESIEFICMTHTV